MITIVARCVVKEGMKEKLIASVQSLIEESRKEAGNHGYDLYEDLSDTSVVAFIERWSDAKAIESHNQSAHFQRGLEAIRSYSESVDIKQYQPI